MPARVALVLALAIVLPMWRQVLGFDLVFLSDALRQHWPFQSAVSNALRAVPGALPAWDPLMLSGHPLLADPQFQVYYPPALLYRFLGFPGAFGLYLAAHLLVAAFGVAVLLGRRGLPPVAAAVGAMAYAMGAHPALLHAVPPVLAAYAWLPWVAVAADRLAVRPGPGTAAGLAVAFGWLALAGYPPYLLYAAGAAAVMLLVRPDAANAAALRWAAAGLAGGLAVAAAMALPFLNYLPDTTRRMALTAQDAAAGALTIWGLLGWFVPEAFMPGGETAVLGAPHLWSTLHYVGVLPLALAIAAWVIGRRDRALRAPRWLAAGGVLLAMAPALPVVGVWLAATPLAWVRHQGLWAGVGGLGLAWLAAAGARIVMEKTAAPEGRKLLAGWAVALVFLLAFGAGTKVLKLGRFRAELAKHPGSLSSFVAERSGLVTTPALWLGLGVLLVWLAKRREIPARTAVAGLAGVAWLDLAGVGAMLQPAAKRDWIMPASATEAALAASAKPGSWERVHVTPRLEQWGLDPGEGRAGAAHSLKAASRYNLPAAAGFRQAGGNNPLRPKGTDAALDRISFAPAKPWDPEARKVFDRLGVRWLITNGEINGPGYRRIHKGHVSIYERERGMTKPAWIPGSGTGTVIAAVMDRPGRWVIEADVRQDAHLIVSESFVRGWRAEGGGRPESSEDGLISIPVTPGRKTIGLSYTAPGSYAGLGLSLLLLLALLWSGARPFLGKSG